MNRTVAEDFNFTIKRVKLYFFKCADTWKETQCTVVRRCHFRFRGQDCSKDKLMVPILAKGCLVDEFKPNTHANDIDNSNYTQEVHMDHVYNCLLAPGELHVHKYCYSSIQVIHMCWCVCVRMIVYKQYRWNMLNYCSIHTST